SIEMVLKLSGRAPGDFYELQNAWKNKADGNFRDFDGKTIKGLAFRQQFDLPRNDKFPLKELFAKIDSELKAGRYVIISLVSRGGWHMHVIYGEDADGDFIAVTKNMEKTAEVHHVKRIVTDMKGTDILTYQTAR